MRRLAVVLLASFLAAPAFAADGCVVDYNTLKVRAVEAYDVPTTVDEQSGLKNAWDVDASITINKLTFVKDSAPVVMAPADLSFLNFQGSVALFKQAADSVEPTTIYALLDGATCEVQPYVRVEKAQSPAT